MEKTSLARPGYWGISFLADLKRSRKVGLPELEFSLLGLGEEISVVVSLFCEDERLLIVTALSVGDSEFISSLASRKQEIFRASTSVLTLGEQTGLSEGIFKSFITLTRPVRNILLVGNVTWDEEETISNFTFYVPFDATEMLLFVSR